MSEEELLYIMRQLNANAIAQYIINEIILIQQSDMNDYKKVTEFTKCLGYIKKVKKIAPIEQAELLTDVFDSITKTIKIIKEE